MQAAHLAILTVVSGYAFSTTWTPSLYHSARESGHRLYLRSVFYAVFLLTVSLALHILLFTQCQPYLGLLEFIRTFYPIQNLTENSIFSEDSKASIVIISFLLGPILGHILNFPRWSFLIDIKIPFSNIKPLFCYEKWLLRHAIKNNDFEKLIAHSVYTNLPILFTLDSGKVYVGWPVSAPNPTRERRSIRILPILSGYRQKDQHTVTFTTNYYSVLNNESNTASLDDFEIVIPTEHLTVCHAFDLELYNLHFQQDVPPHPL